MKSDQFIEHEGVSNMIDDGVEESGGKSYSQTKMGGDESYSDSAKTTIKVKKVIGNGGEDY